MKFVRTEDLKAGMRLAKPIYNKKGVHSPRRELPVQKISA